MSEKEKKNVIPKFPSCEKCTVFLKVRTKTKRALMCETMRAIGGCDKDYWRVATIKALKDIRNSPKNLSLEEGHDIVPDLIKEFLEALEEEKKETTTE